MTAITYTATEGLDLQGTEVGAWLADTTAGNIYAELIANGKFTSATTSWSAVNGATLASVSSELRITANGSSFAAAGQAIITVIGREYTISCTARRGTCAANVTLDVSGLETHTDTHSGTSDAALSVTFTATDTYYFVSLVIDGTTLAGETAYFDNVTTQSVSVDLSATDIDLDVTGALTKAAVATGADLQSWSGWSTSNYLSRIYGADLDITSALTLLVWVKPSTLTGDQAIAGNRRTGSGDYGGYGLNTATGKLRFSVTDNAGASIHAADTADISTTNWTLAAATITTAGLLSLYKNGRLVTTTASGVIGATATLFAVGVENVSGAVANAFSGGISPVRVINSALTAAQILEIYNNEKSLFLPHASYRVVGTSYSLDVIAEAADAARSWEGNAIISLGGAQETIEIRRDTTHSVTIGSIGRIPSTELIAKQKITEFLESVQGGETFSLDIYGSVATPDMPVNVIATPGYNFMRVNGGNLFTVSFNAREV